MYICWLIIILFLTILEISTVNLVSIWFIASAIIALIASFFTDSILIQFAIFVIVGVLLLIFTRKLLTDFLLKKKSIPTNTDRVIGMQAIVTEDISKTKSGEVKVDGKKWTAISDKSIKKDSIVEVISIDGVKLKVKKVEE